MLRAPRRHRRSLMAVLVLVFTFAVEMPSLAQSADTPPARIGLVTGMRQNLGAVGERYDYGGVFGISAGYQPSWLPIGASWSVLIGYFNSADDSNVDVDLSTLEMSFGVHGRMEIPRLEYQYFTAGAGLTLLRSESVLPPDDERSFAGPYAGAGWEGYFLGKYLVGVEARYGLIAGGPESISLNLSLSFGTR